MTSTVAIYDLSERRARTVLESEALIEAPNWTPDGRALIVNGNGRLFRIDLAATSPTLMPIDTGFATALNNDHGISPDGRLLVISDRSVTEGSCIYILPAAGGTPRRVTERIPSYWHGWSPDGRTLAYVGRRADGFQIYTCPVEGGPEFKVTAGFDPRFDPGFDHCDGPDYTPDGRYIWFNGERDGSVDLWRIHPDGTGLQRMTEDAAVNWFPHPSPDGRSVLYLAYAPGTEGHPRDRDVELRLMPADGGPAETLLAFVGGQGTINVPCFAPDGRAFAFVRYG